MGGGRRAEAIITHVIRSSSICSGVKASAQSLLRCSSHRNRALGLVPMKLYFAFACFSYFESECALRSCVMLTQTHNTHRCCTIHRINPRTFSISCRTCILPPCTIHCRTDRLLYVLTACIYDVGRRKVHGGTKDKTSYRNPFTYHHDGMRAVSCRRG